MRHHKGGNQSQRTIFGAKWSPESGSNFHMALAHRIQSMCLIKLIINYFKVIEGAISVESFKNTPKIRKGEKNQQMALPRLEPGPLGLPASKSKQLTTTLTRLSMNYAPQKSII